MALSSNLELRHLFLTLYPNHSKSDISCNWDVQTPFPVSHPSDSPFAKIPFNRVSCRSSDLHVLSCCLSYPSPVIQRTSLTSPLATLYLNPSFRLAGFLPSAVTCLLSHVVRKAGHTVHHTGSSGRFGLRAGSSTLEIPRK